MGNNCKRISDSGIHICCFGYFKEKHCPKNASLAIFSGSNHGAPRLLISSNNMTVIANCNSGVKLIYCKSSHWQVCSLQRQVAFLFSFSGIPLKIIISLGFYFHFHRPPSQQPVHAPCSNMT